MCLHPHSPSVLLFIIPPICQLPLPNHYGDAGGGRLSVLVLYCIFLMFEDMNGSLIVRGGIQTTRIDMHEKRLQVSEEEALCPGIKVNPWNYGFEFPLVTPFVLSRLSRVLFLFLAVRCSLHNFFFPVQLGTACSV